VSKLRYLPWVLPRILSSVTRQSMLPRCTAQHFSHQLTEWYAQSQSKNR
jgi:hypothetical protein